MLKKYKWLLLIIALSVVIVSIGSRDFRKGFKQGHEKGKKQVLMTDVGSAEHRGVSEQYASENFRYKRKGLLGYEMMLLSPQMDKQLESQGYITEDLKLQFNEILSELKVIASYSNDQKEYSIIEKLRKKYDL